jgi:hypothetical protein
VFGIAFWCPSDFRKKLFDGDQARLGTTGHDLLSWISIGKGGETPPELAAGTAALHAQERSCPPLSVAPFNETISFKRVLIMRHSGIFILRRKTYGKVFVENQNECRRSVFYWRRWGF